MVEFAKTSIVGILVGVVSAFGASERTNSALEVHMQYLKETVKDTAERLDDVETDITKIYARYGEHKR